MDDYFEELRKRFDYLNTQMSEAEPMVFRFTTPQEEEFNEFFAGVQEEYARLYGLDIVGSIRCLGLFTYRIAMILTALRLMEGVPMKPVLFCSDTDFQTVLTMVQVLLRHTAKVFETIPTSASITALADKTEAKQNFYNQLPPDFSREIFITLATQFKITQRTAERYIKSFCDEENCSERFTDNTENRDECPTENGGVFSFHLPYRYSNKFCKYQIILYICRTKQNKFMFKIVWDKPHNGVTLTMSSAGEALAIPPRPVFWEELDLLGLNHMGWTYPHTDAPLLWACDRRYFYCGVLVMEVKGGNLYDDPEIVLTPEGKNIIFTPIDIEALRDANADTMFLIEHEAMEFINSVYRRYKGITRASETNPDIDFQALAARLEKKTGEKQVVVKEDCDSFDIMPESEANAQGKGAVLASKIDMFIASFSGGKDSQVLLDLVSRVVPSTDFTVIYSNTGYELPTSLELYKLTEDYYKKIYPELEFLTSENHQPIMYYWDKMGSPSRMHRWCCAVMKTAPLYRLLKEDAGLEKQPSVLVFEGVRAEESERRSQYSRTGKGVKHNNVINARPIFEWNATEIYLYILLHGLPYNDAYRKGLARVGCSICPFSSEWSEHIVMKKYPEYIQGFVDELYAKTAEIGISNDVTKRQYIKEGKWKLRAGGKTSNTEGSSVHFITTLPDFQAVVEHPKEDILKWLVPVGAISIISRNDTDIVGSLKYEKDTFPFTINYDGDNFTITFSNIPNDPIFHSLLKRSIYKATYCVHCEVCEVECPTGALSVVPIVTVNKKKCIHCHKCLTFKDRGCVMANSINVSESINKNNTKMATSGIDRYSTFGMREKWVNEFFSGYENFFQGGNQLGTKMVPACINWFRECEILDQKDKVITPFGLACTPVYPDNQTLIWELLWVNLAYNSQIVNFYTSHIPFNRAFTKPEILALLKENFPEIAEATLGNPLGALCNMFGIGENTIVGDTLQQGLIKTKGRTVETVMRAPYNDVSYKTVAYSLFRYAESKNRRSLTVSEFYADEQDEGIYRQFGIDRPAFERILRTLQEERNHVLNVQLNLGLDNINLREDISSADIIKMMLQ